MLRHRLHVFAGLGLALCAGSASAQDVWATPGAPGGVDVSTAAPAVVLEPEAPATYDAAVLLGTRKIVLRDFEAALKVLREAASRSASRPEAYCRLGDAQLASQDVPEARAAYETCLRFAKTEQNSRHLVLSLVGIARTFERENKTQEERAAWQRVATTEGDEAARALAEGRLAVLDAVLKQKEAYVVVRERISERAKAAPTP